MLSYISGYFVYYLGVENIEYHVIEQMGAQISAY